ncbi:MAG: hypothetical protein GQ531_09675 [Sulfurovum sp.]|nr:hypothetical protein [Sulfurovum sp.]
MKEYRSLVLTIVAIFIVTLLGAYFSPSFTTQKTYLELFMAFGGLLFIFSLVIIFLSLGFQTFSLYMAIVLAVVVALFGVLGAVILVTVTYIVWGSVFAMEILLFDAGALSAKEWFEARYTFKTFKQEFYLFYPMLGFVYILLEVLPNIMKRESVINFSPSRVLKEMEEILK